MDITVIHDDETENEFDIEFCCPHCSSVQYGWSKEQYFKIYSLVSSGTVINVPSSIKSKNQFADYLKSL